MGFSQALVFGFTRDFQSFRNNTNLTCSVGSLVAWDSLLRRSYASAAVTGSGLAATSGDFYGTQGWPNPSQFVTGYDAYLCPVGNGTTDNSVGQRIMAFGCVAETQVLPQGVGRAIGYGFHTRVQVVNSTAGANVETFAPVVANFGAYLTTPYSGYEGRLEPFNAPTTAVSTDASVLAFFTAWARTIGVRHSVLLSRPTGQTDSGIDSTTASYFTAQAWLDHL